MEREALWSLCEPVWIRLPCWAFSPPVVAEERMIPAAFVYTYSQNPPSQDLVHLHALLGAFPYLFKRDDAALKMQSYIYMPVVV